MPFAEVKKVWADRETRDALREYAWANRTTMDAVITAAIRGVRDNPGDDSALSSDDTASQIQLSTKINDADWLAAHEAARRVDRSLNSLVRRRLRKLLIDEGYLQP